MVATTQLSVYARDLATSVMAVDEISSAETIPSAQARADSSLHDSKAGVRQGDFVSPSMMIAKLSLESDTRQFWMLWQSSVPFISGDN